MLFSGETTERALAQKRHDRSNVAQKRGRQVDFDWNTRMKFPNFSAQLRDPEGRVCHREVSQRSQRTVGQCVLNRGHCRPA